MGKVQCNFVGTNGLKGRKQTNIANRQAFQNVSGKEMYHNACSIHFFNQYCHCFVVCLFCSQFLQLPNPRAE